MQFGVADAPVDQRVPALLLAAFPHRVKLVEPEPKPDVLELAYTGGHILLFDTINSRYGGRLHTLFGYDPGQINMVRT
jgi:hypothetical protein